MCCYNLFLVHLINDLSFKTVQTNQSQQQWTEKECNGLNWIEAYINGLEWTEVNWNGLL